MLYNLGTKIKSRKKHPCGSDEWEIIRTGADYKLKCLRCDKVILVNYKTLQKMIKPSKRKEK